MRWRNPLLDDFRRLQAEANHQRRGFDFQYLVGVIFEHAHFDITHNPGSARPRQTDLFATRGSEHYLIETKWRSRAPFDVGDVDSLLARLDRTEDSVIGVVVSMSGFSPNAIARVLERRNRPILLFDATDVERLVGDDADLIRRLRQKREALRTHGRVLLEDDDLLGKRSTRRRRSLPPSDSAFFVMDDGTRRDWFEAEGDFGEFVFADEIPDIDWVTTGGNGVVADLALRWPDRLGIPGIMEKLSAVGWTTASGRWNIQQATRNWHGLGAASLVGAMKDWRSRYAGVERLHHTEQFCYQDAVEGGFYTLTGDVTSEDRRVWKCELSLQLIGVPMEVDSIRQLAQALGATEPWYFRPRAEKSVHRRFFRPSERNVLVPIAVVVEPDHDEEARVDNWVTGIVVQNLFRGPLVDEDIDPEGIWLPMVSQSGVLVCSLGPHHPLDEPRDSYFLRDCEWSWTSDALVFRAVADWD